MTEAEAGPVHAFLAGRGRDGSGRRLAEVLAFDDAGIEGVHDFIQWLFPLDAASRAVPGAPVLGPAEAAAIRADPAARAGLLAARDRMLRFYAGTTGWRRAFDHNHLRITRILTALRDLAGIDEARGFHEAVLGFIAEAGSPVNPESLDYWRRAVDD
ncbi:MULTISPECIES: opioid growth factor receptor-related protein [Methylobacterium]|jgi:hypothetical protein|uniref:opioid growth factor receptor-related protein n=1 Tax=Methylobacterium TaxID=407 RepID=UPI0008EF84A1|nr:MULTISPECIES: opioid growth factor receptor-related protein [Methylobacterium]MBZ6413057.1 hypothetical protein [Methylobacterium sp.]MBK3395474.1 hypothetical protein [Methylobacterium ajmalii]MBK3412187.1 hypothetical protein [Methylobacterium ajmalii]MBK3425802.1 hypothetical protein [Methylobacterium ajmalii]SFF71152.1 Opioid growth factor receptor (OGFr) conserved region [Methylobacterium sp. yr596]